MRGPLSTALTAALFGAVLASTAFACSSGSTPGVSAQPGADGGVADAAGDGAPTVVVEGDYTWVLPAGFPKPLVPTDNPMSVAKVELGRRLFYDTRLSGNGTFSCASCHHQESAFTDGKAHAVGSTNEAHPRGSMSLANIGYATAITWANPLMTTLEQQALIPMFGEHPTELGLVGQEDALLARIDAEPIYQDLFPRAFPNAGPKSTLKGIVNAIATFERTLISGRSPYDRFVQEKDTTALSPAAKQGMDLFFSERLECFHCHGGFSFVDSVAHEGTTFREVSYHNTGLYNIDGKGAFPPDNIGIMAITDNPDDMGRMKAPTLRNIAVTAPYMHDGSITTLEEVVDHYAAGGRTIASGPYAGDGSKSPYRSELVRGFLITDDEKAAVVAFLKSLTDDAFLTDPKFANPWSTDGGAP